MEKCMTTIETKPFALGRVVITSNALERVHPEDLAAALRRHAAGDWGDCCPEDRAENDRALLEGSRLLWVYADRHGERFWIITEWDRSVTTLLLPEDY